MGEVDEAAEVLGSTLFHITLYVTEILAGSCRNLDFPLCELNQELNLNTAFYYIFPHKNNWFVIPCDTIHFLDSHENLLISKYLIYTNLHVVLHSLRCDLPSQSVLNVFCCVPANLQLLPYLRASCCWGDPDVSPIKYFAAGSGCSGEKYEKLSLQIYLCY